MKGAFERANEKYFSIIVNDDPNKVIKWERSDKLISVRVGELLKCISNSLEKLEPLKVEETDQKKRDGMPANDLRVIAAGNEIRSAFDECFGIGTSDMLFGSLNPVHIDTLSGKRSFVSAVEQLRPLAVKSVVMASLKKW